MRDRKPRIPVSDDAKRLIDTVCQALRAANQERVGDHLVSKVAGAGRLLVRSQDGRLWELHVLAEIMLRELLALCTRPGQTDAQCEAACFVVMRRFVRSVERAA